MFRKRSYGFETTWGWVINYIHFIFVWTVPLNGGWLWYMGHFVSNFDGNFVLSNVACTFPLRMGNKFLSGYFRLAVGPVSQLVAHWWQHMPKVAQHCSKSCPMHHQPDSHLKKTLRQDTTFVFTTETENVINLSKTIAFRRSLVHSSVEYVDYRMKYVNNSYIFIKSC